MIIKNRLRNVSEIRQKVYRGSSGLTLLEIMIALSIFTAVAIAAMGLTLTSLNSANTIASVAQTEGALHILIDNMIDTLKEGDAKYAWTSSFNDAFFATTQYILVFLSARNANGVFQIVNGMPSWQSIEVYCPYGYTQNGKTFTEFRHYSRIGVPAAYTAETFNFTATITNTTITLPANVTFQRSSGNILLSNLGYFQIVGFDADGNPLYPMQVSIEAMATTPSSQVPVILTTEIATRNEN